MRGGTSASPVATLASLFFRSPPASYMWLPPLVADYHLLGASFEASCHPVGERGSCSKTRRCRWDANDNRDARPHFTYQEERGEARGWSWSSTACLEGVRVCSQTSHLNEVSVLCQISAEGSTPSRSRQPRLQSQPAPLTACKLGQPPCPRRRGKVWGEGVLEGQAAPVLLMALSR